MAMELWIQPNYFWRWYTTPGCESPEENAGGAAACATPQMVGHGVHINSHGQAGTYQTLVAV